MARWIRHMRWWSLTAVLSLTVSTCATSATRDGTTSETDATDRDFAVGGVSSSNDGPFEQGPWSSQPSTALELAADDLGHKRYAEALARLDPESDRGVASSALRGRALRLLGRYGEAVALLEPLAGGTPASPFPDDAVALELARTRLAWARAGTLSPEVSQAQRILAVDALDRALRMRHLRNTPEVRVERARALLEIRGGSAKDDLSDAKKALAAVEGVLRDYPAYPEVGRLALERARLLDRVGRHAESARELRKIALARAGEPEADDAWSALTGGPERPNGASAAPFSVREELERAASARRLHHLTLSRSILDRILGDANLAEPARGEALRSRATTAYLQQDYAQCAEDWRSLQARTRAADGRSGLAHCLERAGKYDEVLRLPAGTAKAPATAWDAMELAVRGGLYERAKELLLRFEKVSKEHASRRAWLHAWLAFRLGDWEEASVAFEQAERYPSEQTRARYFRGSVLLSHGGEQGRAEGAELLRSLVTSNPYGYYGLQARQRLLDAGEEAPPNPPLTPQPEETDPPSAPAIRDRFASIDERFGDVWPGIRRARQLHAAGYLEEARRELRIAAEAFLSKGAASRGPRSESLFQGLGWKAQWSAPPIALGEQARSTLRDAQASETLRRGLRTLAFGLEEPFDAARLTTVAEAPGYSRWHVRAYREAIEREAGVRDMDPVDLWSLMYVESNFHRHVVSPVGARGALQIMPATARRLAERLGELGGAEPGAGELGAEPFDDDSLFDIDTNAHLAAYYVFELLQKFHGQAPMAYASYNGGPHNVARWLNAKSRGPVPLTLDAFVEEIPFSETYHYTQRVMEASARYAALYRNELPRWNNGVDSVIEDNIDF